MAINCGSHVFLVPEKQIKSPIDMKNWVDSEAFQDLMGFLLAVNSSLRGKTVMSQTESGVDDTVRQLNQMLDKIAVWADEIEPMQQPQRFGNKAFRTFHQQLVNVSVFNALVSTSSVYILNLVTFENRPRWLDIDGVRRQLWFILQKASELLESVLPEEKRPAVPELVPYLTQSFGDPTRIDYGTGHELAFVMLLCCLFKVGALLESNLSAIALSVMYRYVQLVQKVQQRYRMEPAGSRGVWSLDDYQFVPFLWGSAQLLGHRSILPDKIPDEAAASLLSQEYLFFSCLRYIHQVKNGPFAEHSNVLYGISALPGWEKINSGLLKMYKAEVLSKHPVIQHCLFGSILSLSPAQTKTHVLVINKPLV